MNFDRLRIKKLTIMTINPKWIERRNKVDNSYYYVPTERLNDIELKKIQKYNNSVTQFHKKDKNNSSLFNSFTKRAYYGSTLIGSKVKYSFV